MNGATIIFFLELIGTVAFSVSGALIAIRCQLDLFGVVLVCLTFSIGGGIMRDILVDKTPYVLKKHIYALVSVFGSLSYYFIRINFLKMLAIIISIPILIIIRMLSTKYRLELPKISLRSETQ